MANDTPDDSTESIGVQQIRVKCAVVRGPHAGNVGYACGCGVRAVVSRDATLPACPFGSPWGCLAAADEHDVIARWFDR